MNKMVPLPSKAIVPERDADKLPILDVRHLGIDFGGLTAVDDFNFTMGRTEIGGLIGPNGAGKTTVFNLLTNVYRPTRGSILLDGVDTLGMSTWQRSALWSCFRCSICRTLQTRRQAAFPTARSGGLKSSGRLQRNPALCCLTNPPRA